MYIVKCDIIYDDCNSMSLFIIQLINKKLIVVKRFVCTTIKRNQNRIVWRLEGNKNVYKIYTSHHRERMWGTHRTKSLKECELHSSISKIDLQIACVFTTSIYIRYTIYICMDISRTHSMFLFSSVTLSIKLMGNLSYLLTLSMIQYIYRPL